MKKVKMFEQFVFEKMVLGELETEFDIELDLYDNGKHLELSRIVIPKEERGKGLGSKVMQIIVDYADKNKKKIYLTPSKDFGASSVSRLENFYKEFGFVMKPKDDFSTKEKMVRFPL
jgi:predicted GNAT family N-acyltransferase